MCEVVTKIILDGKSYLIPLHSEYESPRLNEIQECILPMARHLGHEFPQNGTISLTWDDDRMQSPLSLNTSAEIELSAAIESWNRFEPSLPCLTELRSKT